MTKKGINFTQLQANTNWAFALMEMVVKNKLAEVRKDNDSMTEKECEKCVYFQEYSQVTGEVICGLYGMIVTGVCEEYQEEW